MPYPKCVTSACPLLIFIFKILKEFIFLGLESLGCSLVEASFTTKQSNVNPFKFLILLLISKINFISGPSR